MMENSPELEKIYRNSPLGPKRAVLERPGADPLLIPTAKVTAVIQTFNAAEGLRQTLESLKDRVDRIIVLDGFFSFQRGNPHPHPAKTSNGASSDNSGQIVKQYGGEWYSGDREYKTQMDKLNRIPELVPEGEWFLLIDTDEVLVSYMQDGLRTVAGWFGQYECDMVMFKIDEPYYQHPWTGVYGRHRFYARLLRSKKAMRWVNEGTIIYPDGRYNTYAGTFPSTVFLRHNRRSH